jgi:hypothetical protein
MGNKLHKDKKENHYCNKEIHFNNNTYICGFNEYSIINDNNGNFHLYKYQCHECENKESKEKELFFIKNYLLKNNKINNNDLNNFFTRKEVCILLNDNDNDNTTFNINYNDMNQIINLINKKKIIFDEIMNLSFNEFGIEWYLHYNDVSLDMYNYKKNYMDYSVILNAPQEKSDYYERWMKKYKEKKEFDILPWTILNHYIKFDNYEIIKFLLLNGAKVNIKDLNNDDAISLAKLINNEKIVKLLNEYNYIINDFLNFNLFFDIKFFNKKINKKIL